MSLPRRTVLQAAGTASLAALAGCSSLSDLLSGSGHEYALSIDPVDQSLVDHALYDPDEGTLFSRAARDALDAIFPDGRDTTYGFEPLPVDAYVEYEGRYYQIQTVVTGRERRDRTLVRLQRIDGGRRTDGNDAPGVTSVDSLPRASARVVEILHTYHATGGSSVASDRLRDDAYVLRRPAELNGPIADDLDGSVVRMNEEGGPFYRVVLTTEAITEPVYETFATEVAPDRATFREVVLATRVDAAVERADLDRPVRDLLESTIEADVHRETTPLSAPFARLVERLGLDDVGVGENGLLLWYDESLFRYGLYVTPVG